MNSQDAWPGSDTVSLTASFYAYRLADSSRAVYSGPCRVEEIPDLVSLDSRNAFVISDFHGRMLALFPDAENPDTPDAPPPFPTHTPREAYMAGAEKIIADLRLHPDRKVVYSRVGVYRRHVDPCRLFADLCARYPSAYVFCYHTPSTGTWAGASPELLCRHTTGRVESMALAGTRRAGDPSPWDHKNIEEHDMVRRFIEERFAALGIEVTPTRTVTRRAGPVEHLCTPVIAATPVSLPTALRLPVLLSPTPALCGLPREYAMDMIRAHESHDRGCYGGFLGPVAPDGQYQFWVNLRCMRISSDRVALYVGGGLTHLSDPGREWEETQAKALTLAP